MNPEDRSPSERDRSTLLSTIAMLVRDLEEMTQQRDFQRHRREQAQNKLADWEAAGYQLRTVAQGQCIYYSGKKVKTLAQEILDRVPKW